MTRLILLSLLTAVLSGCSSMNPLNWLADEDNAEQPAELSEMANKIEPEILWKRSIGAGTDEQRVKLVPLVSQGKVYVAERNGNVRALAADTGNEIWSVDTDLEISGGPGLGNGIILLGTSNAELVALDMETGAQKWRSLVSSEVLSVPTAARGVVVVHTVDGKLFGMDPSSGEQLWLYDRSIPVLTLHGSSSPVISGNQVICGFASGKLAGLDLDTGVPVWETTITSPGGRSELERMVDIDSDPLIVQDAVFVTTYQGDLAAVFKDTGVVAWRRKLSAYAGMAADWKRLFVSDSNDHVWAIDPRNSSAIWKNKSLQARQISGPAVLDEYVIVGDYEGYLHWLSPDDGSLLARISVGKKPITVPPIVVDEVAYVYGSGGELAAIRLPKP